MPERLITSIKGAFKELRAYKPRLSDVTLIPPCYTCSAPTKRALVDYGYDVDLGGMGFRVSKQLPGTSCTNEACDMSYMDHQISEGFLQAVANGLSALGDPRLQRELLLRQQDPSTYTFVTPIP